VQIALRHPANTFWNGATFVAYNANTCWLSATQVLTSSWTFTNLPTTWDDNTIFRLYVRAIDRAGNPVSDPSPFSSAGTQFIIDRSSPTSGVTSLSVSATSYLNAPITTITGTADDGSGSDIDTVYLRVRR